VAPGFYPPMMVQLLVLAELGRVEEARDVCREVIQLQMTHANALFIGVAFMELLGFPGEAREAIREFESTDAATITAEDADDLFLTLALGYLNDRADEDMLLASSRGRPGMRCELAFLIALRRLGRGDREGGLAALEIARDTQIFRFFEHRFAQILLTRAAADPEWPRWLD